MTLFVWYVILLQFATTVSGEHVSSENNSSIVVAFGLVGMQQKSRLR